MYIPHATFPFSKAQFASLTFPGATFVCACVCVSVCLMHRKRERRDGGGRIIREVTTTSTRVVCMHVYKKRRGSLLFFVFHPSKNVSIETSAQLLG